MIELQVKDSNGNELNLGDVILYRFPNPNVISIGTLRYDEHYGEFNCTNEDGNEWRFPNRFGSCERLCHINECRELEKYLGNNIDADEKMIDKIYSLTINATCAN